MTLFWTFSNCILEKYEADDEIQNLCEQIAEAYLERDKQEYRLQNAHEENIILKLDVENFDSLCSTVTENNAAHAKLHNVLKDTYEEQLKISFEIGEFELEKMFRFDEIKVEMERRESHRMNQKLYLRKMKMARKMENRNIVKECRTIELQLSKTEKELVCLEESLRKLEKDAKAMERHHQELVLRLVKGSKDLKTMYSTRSCKNDIPGEQLPYIGKLSSDTLKESRNSCAILQKGGLSSRLFLDFSRFTPPSTGSLPRIQMMNPTNGLNHLLQQADILRKHMEKSVGVPSEVVPLTESDELLKSSNRSVSFEQNLQEISVKETPPDHSFGAITGTTSIESGLKESIEKTRFDLGKSHVEILENVLLKAESKPLPIGEQEDYMNTQSTCDIKKAIKRSIASQDHNYATNSPPKKNCTVFSPEKSGICLEMDSRNFMDLFLDLSKDTPPVSSSVLGLNVKPNQENMKEIPVKDKAVTIEAPCLTVRKSKKSKIELFEDFFAGLEGNENEANEDNETPFDFFEANENADDLGDAESDNFSFQF